MHKIFLRYALIILPALFSLSCTLRAQDKAVLSPDDFQKKVANKDVQLLDVRTAGEYQGGHISQALQADWNSRQQFVDRVQALDKHKAVYVYCLAGGRSAAAASWMRDNGYDSVIELKGGINAWKSANKPLEDVAPVSAIPLDTYKASINKTGWVLADFGAPWCPPCKKMQPVITQLQKDAGPSLTLVNIDGGAQTDLMKQLQVEGIPTFILYHNGKEVWRSQGITPLEEFKRQMATH
jgi:rhodanese-related sulfurtransferase